MGTGKAQDGGVLRFALRHEYLAAALVYSLLLLVLLAPSLLGGRVFTAADFTYESAPWKYYRPAGWEAANSLRSDDGILAYPQKVLFHDEVALHGVPFWNSYKLAGYPFAEGVSQASWFTPLLGWLTVIPAPVFVDLYAFVRLLLAALATYLFARTLHVSKLGSFLAGAVFMLSGPLIVWLSQGPTDTAFAFPALLACIEGYLTDGRKRWLLATPMVIGYTLAMSWPGSMVHLALIGGAYALIRAWQRRAALGSLWPRLGMLAAAGVLGGGIGALGVHTAYTFASMGPQADRVNALIQLPASSALLLVFPNMFGHATWGSSLLRLPATAVFDPIASNYCESAIYVGLAPLVLGPVAVWAYRRSAKVKLLTGMAAVMALVIYANPLGLNRMLAAIPIVQAVGHVRLLTPLVMILAVLAGTGLDALRSGKIPSPLSGKTRAIIGAAAGTLTIGAAALMASITRQTAEAVPAADRIEYLAYQNREMLTIALLAALLLLIVFVIRKYAEKAAWAPRLLVVFAIVDLLMFGAGFNPQLDPDVVLPPSASIEQLRDAATGWRVAPVIGDSWGIGPGDVISAYGIQTISGIDWMGISPLNGMLRSVDPAFRNASNAGSQLHASAHLPSPVINALGVRYLVTDPSDVAAVTAIADAGYQPVYDYDIVVFENTAALPRAWSVERVAGADTIDDHLSVVSKDTWNPSALAVADRASAGSYSRASVDLTDWRPGSLSLSVRSPGRAFIVVSEMAIPEWRATIDGKPAEVVTTDYALLGTVVPEGDHTVTFAYVSPGFAEWARVSGLSLALWALVAVGWPLAERRRSATAAAESEA
jgi:hypothetical protein